MKNFIIEIYFKEQIHGQWQSHPQKNSVSIIHQKLSVLEMGKKLHLLEIFQSGSPCQARLEIHSNPKVKNWQGKNNFWIDSFEESLVGKDNWKKQEVRNFLIKSDMRKLSFKLERSWKVFNAILKGSKFPISFQTFQLKVSNFSLPTALYNYMNCL